jgi:hypothetical protein
MISIRSKRNICETGFGLDGEGIGAALQVDDKLIYGGAATSINWR